MSFEKLYGPAKTARINFLTEKYKQLVAEFKKLPKLNSFSGLDLANRIELIERELEFYGYEDNRHI